MIVVNPNNPSGVTVATQSLYDAAARTPDTTFLVDESFLVFSGQPSLIRLLEAAAGQRRDPDQPRQVTGGSRAPPGLPLHVQRGIAPAVEGHMPIWGVNALAEFFRADDQVPHRPGEVHCPHGLGAGPDAAVARGTAVRAHGS